MSYGLKQLSDHTVFTHDTWFPKLHGGCLDDWLLKLRLTLITSNT